MDFSNPDLLAKYKADMKKRGFIIDDNKPTKVVNENYIVSDLHENNVFVSDKGNFFFIDTIPRLNTAESGFGGTRKYGSGNVIAFSTEIPYKGNENKFGNSEKSSIFAELNNNENGTNRKETGMDNRQGMVDNALRELVGEQQEGERVYRTITDAYNRRSNRTTEATGQNTWNKELFLGELEVAALNNNTWINDILSIADKVIAKGQENEVHYSKDRKKAIKVNNLSLLDAEHNFDTFIDRLQSHNELFTNVLYKIIGFGENSLGETSIILEQPYINNGMPTTQQEIDNYLKAQGFIYTRISDGEKGWTNGKYELWDAKPKNVLKDKNGILYFIDTVVNHVSRAKTIESNNKIYSATPKGKTLDETGLPLC